MSLNNRFDPWHDQIPFYVAGTLPARERLAFTEHLRDCPACQAEVEAWRTIAEAVRAETTARVALHEVPTLDLSKLPALERKSKMSVNHPAIEGRAARPQLRSTSRTRWIGSGTSVLAILLMMALALGVLIPIMNTRYATLLRSTTPSTRMPTVLSALPSDNMPSGPGLLPTDYMPSGPGLLPNDHMPGSLSNDPTPSALGPLPSNCPPSPVPMEVTPNVGVAVGGYPLWVAMGAYGAALTFDGEARYTTSGWEQKVLLMAQTDYAGIISVHGENLKTNAPLRFDPFPTEGPTVTTLTIDTRVINVSPSYHFWLTIPGYIYIPEAGCYSLEMDWAGGSWRIAFPAGQVSVAMQTATANALPTLTGSPAPSLSPTPNSTETAFNCSATSVSFDAILQATETALPFPMPLTPGQTSPPPPTFGPIPMDQKLGCPESALKLSTTPIATCAASASELQSTASPTAALPGAIEIDCLPAGKNVYTIVCPPTIPMADSLSFQVVLGPPFPSCADTTLQPSTLVPKITRQGTPTPRPAP